jgi:thiamine pyrophosphate-dependent acetolactate synthase large subunit-like protein
MGEALDARDKTVRDRAREAERYREAAELALDQLKWCVDYLYRIRKPTLAKGLKANREHIHAELRRIAERS